MDIFQLLFAIGATGLVAMTFLSFGKFSFRHGHGLTASHGHVAHPLHGGAHGRLTAGHHGAASPVAHTGPSLASRVGSAAASLLLITPIDLFVYCLGAGAAGILLRGFLSGKVFTLTVVAIAIALNFLIFRPYAAFILKFQTTPSDGLEGQVGKNGKSLQNFDKMGRGVVEVEFDGQTHQVLAYLERDETQAGLRVAKGDSLVIISVDPKKNTCGVSKKIV